MNTMRLKVALFSTRALFRKTFWFRQVSRGLGRVAQGLVCPMRPELPGKGERIR